jgi:LmbE family N-acetylglucosaminyl deacetylase
VNAARGAFATLAGLFAAAPSAAQDAAAADLRDRGEVALHQAVRDAACDQLALLVASHPDDQYLQPAAILRFRHGWRVAVALMTRGEGGQNVSGSETGDALAARRTLEMERCAARLGLEVHHLDRPDSGFCRSAEEALDLWGRGPTANDLAQLIRSLRPDVIWTTHHPDEEHGHDLALLRLLPDAIERAASPLYRYEGLPAHRVRAAVRGCGAREESTLQLPGDGMDAERGETYRALAHRALTEHRSQAPHRPLEQNFPAQIRLRSLLADAKAVPAVFDAHDDMFVRLAAAGVSATALDTLRTGFAQRLPALVGDRRTLATFALELRRELMRVPAATDPDLQRRLLRRSEALDAVVVHALSLAVTASPPEAQVAVAGETLPIRLRVQHGDVMDIDRVRVSVPAGGALEPSDPVDLGALTVGTSLESEFTCRVAPRDPLAAPEFTAPKANLHLEIELMHQRVVWPITAAVAVRTALAARATRPALLWPREQRTTPIAVQFENNLAATAKGLLLTRAPVGWSIDPASFDTELVGGAKRIFTFNVLAPADLKPGVSTLRLTFQDAVAEVAIHSVDVTTPAGLRVGLVPGVDDASRRVLEDLGVDLHILDGDDIATFALASLDTVLIDIRALRTQATARAAFARLLQFVENGGRLVVLYHKDLEWEAPGFVGSPFPLRIGRGRVTQEDAPVNVLRPDHVLLTTPNRVAAPDWDGWVQERGLYFAASYDPRYEEILATADAGYPELRGGLLYARHGAGDYVFCALALFRQLKKLHPGACRLFANLVAPARTTPR